MATASIANKPSQPIHLYFLIHLDIMLVTVAMNKIDRTKPKTSEQIVKVITLID